MKGIGEIRKKKDEKTQIGDRWQGEEEKQKWTEEAYKQKTKKN